MMRLTTYIIWFVAGALLGVITENLLSAVWIQLGWRQPVADLLAAHGHSDLAGYLGLVWLRLPDWFVLVVVGFFGGVLIKHRTFISLLIFGVGFIAMPTAVAMVAGFSPAALGLGVWLSVTAWDSVGIILLLGFGILGLQCRRHAHANASTL